MNRTQRSLKRLFRPSRQENIDDLADVETSFRRSSFALLPSAVIPSRAPSNTFIASSQTAFLKAPPRFHIPYGQDKILEVVDWYNHHASEDSTAIDKIQLRKDHQHPYYHEGIIIFTRGGHTYRVDRRPAVDAPFDTIMKEGCTAYDTIEEVDSTALKKLDGASDCVVEFHWRGEQTIDLLFVLAICFRIHNDNWTKRYTLQHFNCYFVSWTIIMVIVRNATAWGAGLNMTMDHGVWPEGLHIWQVGLSQDLELERQQELGLTSQDLDLERQQELVRSGELDRGWKQEEQEEQALNWDPKVLLDLDLDLKLTRARTEELEAKGRVLSSPGQSRIVPFGQEPPIDKLDRERERLRDLEWAHKWARENRLWRAQYELRKLLAQMLAEVPLVLGWQLAQGWKQQKANVQQKLQELIRDADIVYLPGELDILAKTTPGRSEWLRKTVSRVIIQIMEDPRGELCRALSDLAYFPALSATVSFNNKYWNPVEANPVDANMYEVTPTQLEEQILAVIENHAVRVARWKLGSRAEVESAMLEGMWRIWQDVSHLDIR